MCVVPWEANARAVARPIPDDVPVITAVRLGRRGRWGGIFLLFFVGGGDGGGKEGRGDGEKGG